MAVEPVIGNEATFGNRFAYFEFKEPKGSQVLRHQFKIKVWELQWNLDHSKVLEVESWPASFDRYRQGDSQAVIVDQRFHKMFQTVVPNRKSADRDLVQVMQWVQDNFEYDHHNASLQANAEHALNLQRGHCSDFHSFCASLGRVIGVPTRVTYGINAFPKNSPSHCKLEAYLHPYGWVSFDVSETQKLVKAIRSEKSLSEADRVRFPQLAQARFNRGFRDNTWFLQTRGTDYDLAPAASRRVAVVRTAFVEADGKVLPEPDPADPDATSFSWMTVHDYRADRKVTYPFTDWTTLEKRAEK